MAEEDTKCQTRFFLSGTWSVNPKSKSDLDNRAARAAGVEWMSYILIAPYSRVYYAMLAYACCSAGLGTVLIEMRGQPNGVGETAAIRRCPASNISFARKKRRLPSGVSVRFRCVREKSRTSKSLSS